MEPVRLGRVPAGLGAPDRFVAVESGEAALLRVDLYSSSDEAFVFEDVRIWSKFAAIGWGEYVYLVDPRTRQVSTIPLGSHFGHMYPTENHLLVASGERLLSIAPAGNVVWQSEHLGIDGVVVNKVDGEVVQGEGEWGPPGGWRPFSVSLRSGQTL